MDVGALHTALPNGVQPATNGDQEQPIHIHVEVVQKQFSTVTKSDMIKQSVLRGLQQNSFVFGEDCCVTKFEDPILQEHVESVLISNLLDHTSGGKTLDLKRTVFNIHVFRLCMDGPAQEELEEEEDLSAANHWLLPAADFQGLWENLVFDTHIKQQLLQYASTTLLFSDRLVDSNIISWNRVILLHGPPGTGKTSLCKALAQKLCIQLSDRYSYGQLIEINSHSLFSKWFSESGKLVMKLFQKIQGLIDDKDALVCVLMDEVESLAAARKSAMSGTEPSDAIRVVNALLTQLDQIKKNPNVMILTTSNITGAIDLAFVDRADIKQYIGPPSAAAIYTIYKSCIMELMKTRIIVPKESFVAPHDLAVLANSSISTLDNSHKLHQISIKSEGLSGRALRKLPFVAHALYLQKPCVTVGEFLSALDLAVTKQFQEQEELTRD